MSHPRPVCRLNQIGGFPLLAAAALFCLVPACAGIPEGARVDDSEVHLVQYDKEGSVTVQMALIHERHSQCDALMNADAGKPSFSAKKIPSDQFATLLSGLLDLSFFKMAERMDRLSATDSDTRLTIRLQTPLEKWVLDSTLSMPPEDRENLTDMVSLIMRHHAAVPNLRCIENEDPNLFGRQQKKLQKESGNRVRYNK